MTTTTTKTTTTTTMMATIYAFIIAVEYVLYLSCEKNENKQKETGFGPFKKTIFRFGSDSTDIFLLKVYAALVLCILIGYSKFSTNENA